jgi:hypothetical protein
MKKTISLVVVGIIMAVFLISCFDGGYSALLSAFNRLGISYTKKTTPSPTPAKSAFSDKIESYSSFVNLPTEIKSDLSKKYSQASIKSGVHWEVSTASYYSVRTLDFANLVNKVSGGVLAAIEGGKDKVYDWLAEEILKTVASSIIAYGTSDAAADVTIMLYDSYKLYPKVAKKTFKAITQSAQLSAEVAAWVLSTEMTYINNNVSKGFSKITGLNWGSGPMHIYVVGVDGENFEGRIKNGKLINENGFYDKGLKFYYYSNKTKKYINYYDDIVSRKLEVKQTKKSSWW